MKLFGPVKSRGQAHKQKIQSCIDEFKSALNKINLPLYQKYDQDLEYAEFEACSEKHGKLTFVTLAVQ